MRPDPIDFIVECVTRNLVPILVSAMTVDVEFAVDREPIWEVLGADDARSCRDHEGGLLDHEKLWDGLMAEAMGFLISAHASLQNLSRNSFHDPQAERILALVSGKVVEALSALDDFTVTKWITCGPSAGISDSFAHMHPTWSACLDDLG
jgi:hypothetical protein